MSCQTSAWAEQESPINARAFDQNQPALADPSTAGASASLLPLPNDDSSPVAAISGDQSLIPDPSGEQLQGSKPQSSLTQVKWEQTPRAEGDAATSEQADLTSSAQPPATSPVSEIVAKDNSPLPESQGLTSDDYGVNRRETSVIPAHPSLFSDRMAQFPEASPPEESSAGRRPMIRTQPTTPDESPLDLRQELLTPKKSYSPSITILTPSAYGKSWRQASVGFGVQQRTRFTNSADGAFGVGIGFGDAQKYVGLDVGLTLTDLQDFERAIISFKVHRQLPHLLAIAVGVNDAISIGNGDVDGPSPYGVVTKTFILKENTEEMFSRVYLSAGAGTGRYRTESNVFTDSDTPGVFGSVALRIFDPMNAIAEWSGQDLSLGLSIRPFREIPLIITPAVTDITGTAGDGVRFILGIGYAISF